MKAARRLLVVQMCRMGDILQTGPMLRGLKRDHPDAELTLVLLDGFAGTPIPAHLYDRLVPFPMIPLAAGLMPGSDWQPELERLRGFLHEVGEEPFDLAVNLTQTPLSAALMTLIPARERRGPFLRDDRQSVVLGAWMQHFWSTVRYRVLACFNLVDLFAWIAGVGCDGRGLEIAIPEAAEARAGAWLAEQGLSDRPLIAVQLGASEEAKRWPAESFAAAADLLPRESGEIVLVGTAPERPLAARFLAAARRRAYDATGVTSLTELAALLRRCRLLITNDTGTMHVAAAVGTRVVDLSTGSVFVHETGPYGCGHLVLEPDLECFPCAAGARCHHQACRHRLTPEDVAATARFALGEGAAPHPAGGRLLTAHRTPTGRLEYWPLEASRVTAADVLRHCIARVWEETLPRPTPAPDVETRPGHGATPEFPATEETVARLRTVAEAAEEVARLASGAAAVVKALPGARNAQRSHLASEAHAHLERLLRLAKVERACHPFIDALMIEIDAIATVDLRDLARGQVEAYTRAATRGQRLAALLRASLASRVPTA